MSKLSFIKNLVVTKHLIHDSCSMRANDRPSWNQNLGNDSDNQKLAFVAFGIKKDHYFQKVKNAIPQTLS